MNDYSDPSVWKAFLSQHNLPSDAPVPPKALLLGLDMNDSVQVESSLSNWANSKSPSKRTAMITELSAPLDALLEEVL